MGSAPSSSLGAEQVGATAVAGISAIKGHTPHESPVLPRIDFPTALAFITLIVVSALGTLHMIPVYPHMMLVTVCTIYIGSRYSLKCWKIEGTPSVDEQGQEQQHRGEQMQTKDAYMFPVIGSCVLFSLYLVYRYLPKEYVNFVIKCYFFIFGALVLAQKFAQILSAVLPPAVVHAALKRQFQVPNPLYAFAKIENIIQPIINKASALFTSASPSSSASVSPSVPVLPLMPLSLLDVLSLLLSLAVSVWYINTGYWLPSNMFGVAFSIQGIEMLSLGSFFNGCILLSGLFFYDIFWVFGTEVMVSVAKSFDAPIKLLFPQMDAAARASMLGLGDIVIPGIFIALLLRYDIYRNQQAIYARKAASSPSQLSTDEKHSIECLYCHVHTHAPRLPFFYANLVAYFIGLTTTVGVMYAFEAAQPALLYLVPACLGCSLIQALIRGEFSSLYAYDETPSPASETVSPAAPAPLEQNAEHKQQNSEQNLTKRTKTSAKKKSIKDQ